MGQFNVVMAIFMAVLGACLGSFLALVIYRLPLEQSIVWPRSHCDTCKKQLLLWHNIPIISWLILRGRCGFCHAAIGLRSLVIELLCAMCMLALYLKLGLSIALFIKFSFFFILIGLSYIDIDYFSLPYSLLLALFFLGVLTNLIYFFNPELYVPLKDDFGLFSLLVFKPSAIFSLKSKLWAGFIALLFFSSLNLLMTWILRRSSRLSSEQWVMGWGDPLLASIIGLFVGLSHLALVIFLASFIGSICGIALKWSKRSEDSDIPEGAVPFGPFLSIAAIYIYLF